MNPWLLLLNLLGWTLLAVTVLAVLVIVYAIITATVRALRARRRPPTRTHTIIVSEKEDQ